MKIEILEPKGYCSGVVNAIYIAKKARKEHPDKKISVFGMLVHNKFVTDFLLKENIITIAVNDPIKDFETKVDNDSVVIFTAHGHDVRLDDLAKKKKCIVYDAVCPKVKFNHELIKKEIENNGQIIYVGQMNHPETLSALSLSKKVILYDTKLLINYQLITNDTPLVINQTTLNIYALKDIFRDIKVHFPNAKFQNEVCDATRKRQENISNIDDADTIIVIGDHASSNTNRLYEIAKQSHPSILTLMVESKKDIDLSNLINKKHIIIASGSSTPPEVIDELYTYLNESLN